jgi:AraC-like DNA-binding protein
MVSARCKMLVQAELEKHEIPYNVIELGEVDLVEKLTSEKHASLKAALNAAGLDILSDKKLMLVEKIKTAIIKMIHYADELPDENYSVYLSNQLNHNYTYLANVFSDVQGITIERFIISHKIEKVKELLAYDELSLTEIADLLHYSSIGHLSNQFKKVTGTSPSAYKNKTVRRKDLDKM